MRRAAVAGSWYPGTPDALRAAVAGHLAAASAIALDGRLVGLVVPHAGLRYSGDVAAHAYRLLEGRRDLTAVLVGPSHRVAFDGAAIVARGSFDTPLGEIPIDEGLAAALLAASDVVLDLPGAHREEHSLEMQLPFLQHLVPGLRIVPLLLGSQDRDECEALADALGDVARGRDDVVLIASSDLSHYQPAPIASALDAEVVRRVERFDAESLMVLLERERGHACGGGAIVSVLSAARASGATRTAVLRYADSGDAGERDKSRVVGYLAAAVLA